MTIHLEFVHVQSESTKAFFQDIIDAVKSSGLSVDSDSMGFGCLRLKSLPFIPAVGDFLKASTFGPESLSKVYEDLGAGFIVCGREIEEDVARLYLAPIKIPTNKEYLLYYENFTGSYNTLRLKLR